MHARSCSCPRCQSQREPLFPVERFGAQARPAPPLNEADEVELAMELLGVSNEEEWEQFLGKMFKSIGRGLKKVGGAVLKPLGGALKSLAKKALPVLGGALGSFIPIPGVGTAIGTAVGSAVSKALELEFGEMEGEDAEFETALRIVRVATGAAQKLADAPPGMPPQSAVRHALLAAARSHVPGFAANEAELMNEAEAEAANEAEGQAESQGEGEDEYQGEYQGETAFETGAYGASAATPGRAASGRWQRRGRHIVLLGA